MSAGNSIARAGREPAAQAEQIESELPAELRSRYDVRLVEEPGGDQRIGLFRPGDRAVPAIEITVDRIVARREDAETIDSLVRIAQHSGWDRIDVQGSLVFRQAVWAAATREGLSANGYEPSFAEREQADAARRGAQARDVALPETAAAQPAQPGRGAIDRVAAPPPGRTEPETGRNAGDGRRELTDDDSRLLLRISALTEDRQSLVETLAIDMPRLAREVQVERLDDNGERLATALDRALESPSLALSFARSGYPADDLRGMAERDEWDGGVADAIYLVRTGLHRDTMRAESRGRQAATDLRPEPDSRDVDQAAASRSRAGEPAERPTGELPPPPEVARRGSGEVLAELFLRGSSESVAADPRLAGASRAQSAMEQHIGEVFGGDATRVASATLESRQMISDVLRRGLDVSVREPTPVRQIEPMQMHPDLER